jgi:two-component system sensor kinase FixL
MEVAGLVRSDTIIKNISLTLDLAPDLPQVRGDRVQLQQVVLNLMLNAIDAMKGTAGSDRRLVARTENGEGVVRVAVQDSGTGIPADQLEHIFEPFFTTKADGMGMGLAIARSILRSHGGRLWAENNPTGGATFTLALPTVQ